MQKKIVAIGEEIDFANIDKVDDRNKIAEDFTAKKLAGKVDCLGTYLAEMSEKAPKVYT